MNDANTASNPTSFKHSSMKTTRSGRSRTIIVLWLAFCAIAFFSFRTSSRMRNRLPNRNAPAAVAPAVSPGDATQPAPPDYSAALRRYNKDVSAALDRHIAQLGKIAGKFEEYLRTKGPRQFDGVRAAIPGIRKLFSSFGAMCKIVTDGACDKAFGGDRLQTRFNAALNEPFMLPCARAGQSLIAAYETFAEQMAAEGAAFREELAAAHFKLPEEVRVEFPIETLRDNMEQAYAALRGMPLKVGLVAAEVAYEAACIKTTVSAVCNLALRFGGKAIAKEAASVAAPLADGLLPIGDIIGVCGAIWTAYDIYDLVDVLPKEIEKSLKGTVDSLQTQTLNAVSNAARQIRASHEQAARALATAACIRPDCLPSLPQ